MLRRKSSTSSTERQNARRQFLKLGTCSAMTNTTLLSGLLNTRLTSAAMAAAEVPTSGYKALVCVFFNGAIDGFQVLTPFGDTTGDTEFGYYAASRTNMSLKREDPANPGNPGNGWDTAGQAAGGTYGYLQRIHDSQANKYYGLHPRFIFLKQLYNAGRATFCANVGSLIQPIANLTQYNNQGTYKRPIGLFSHPDLQRHWQTAVPTSRNQVKGWGGKMADLLTDPLVLDSSRYYSAISTLGANIWETGNRVLPYAVSAQSGNVTTGAVTSVGGAVLLGGYAPNPSSEYTALDSVDKAYSDMQNDLVNQTYVDLLEKSILQNRADARDAGDVFQAAVAAAVLPTTMPATGGGTEPTRPFDVVGGSLGAQLAIVARAIKQRHLLGYASGGRQIFMVQVGGWDHHANLLQNQNTMIPLIDSGLKSFHDFLNAEGLLNDVTTFTISDFGRTISSNGIGTDHAWGNNMIVMGGALNQATGGGPRIWGTYPQIRLGTAQARDTSTRGTYIPSMSTDSYHAELALWFGLPNNTTVGSPLRTILPNITNFYTGGGSTHPVGFMNY
jgi:uncharacterized protein (DUF1501 family)